MIPPHVRRANARDALWGLLSFAGMCMTGVVVLLTLEAFAP